MIKTMPHEVAIREATADDAVQIAAIYNHYIENSTATFDTEKQSAAFVAERLATLQKGYPFLVAHQGDTIVGYAYASTWKTKPAYKHSAETTIYMHPDYHAKGVGLRLYNALLTCLPLYQIVNAIACLTVPNEASEGLHQKLGFKRVGRFDKVGFKNEQWLDVEYWQRYV